MSTPIDPLLTLKAKIREEEHHNRRTKVNSYVIALSKELLPLFKGQLPSDLAEWPRHIDFGEAFQTIGRVTFVCYGITEDADLIYPNFRIEFKKLRRFLFWRWVSKATIKSTHITAEMAVYALGCQRRVDNWQDELEAGPIPAER